MVAPGVWITPAHPQDTTAGTLARLGLAAYAGYTRVLTDWRRFPYLDPGLPAELLPGGWIGISAAEEFFALRALLEEPAQAYVRAVLGG